MLIIFDCDGVLVDSEWLANRVLAAYLTELGLPTSFEESVERYIGGSIASVRAKAEAALGRSLPDDFEAELWARDQVAFDRNLKPIDGVATVLEAIGHATCVASSGTPEKIRHSLGLTGLDAHFGERIFSASQVAHGKPAPDLFEFAAGRMSAAVEDCLVIEDSVAGVTAARAAGMAVFGFTGGGHATPALAEALSAAGAALVFDEMRELPARVDGSRLAK